MNIRLTELQKQTAQALVNIFETGKPLGDYGQVTLLPNDPGRLTYGRSQASLASRALAHIVRAYCDANGGLSARLAPYLPALEAMRPEVDHDVALHALLREAGADPVMRRVQDALFDAAYWEPALREADQDGLREALSAAVVYDSLVHGGYRTVRSRLGNGPVPGDAERLWIGRYVDARRAWLAGHANPLLHKTVYRMDAFRALIATGKWGLELPLTVRDVVLTEGLLAGAPMSPTRLLQRTQPPMCGDDVRAAQRRLGFAEPEVDGVYGPKTEAAVRAFQQARGLTVDGCVGPITRAMLEV